MCKLFLLVEIFFLPNFFLFFHRSIQFVLHGMHVCRSVRMYYTWPLDNKLFDLMVPTKYFNLAILSCVDYLTM